MGIVASSRLPDLLYFLVVSISFYLILNSEKFGYNPRIRLLPAVQGMDEAVGRSAELGRPAFYTTWMSDISNITRYFPIMAGLSCLGYVARLCARYNVQLYTIYNFPEVEPLQDGILRSAYVAESKPDSYDPTEQLIYTPQWSNVISTLNIMQTKNIGAAFYIGASFYAQAVYPEIGIRVGAFQVGGTNVLGQYLIMGCDYALIGEEIYAASAFVSGEEKQIRTVATSDWLKLFVLGLLGIGIILNIFGSNLITSFLGG